MPGECRGVWEGCGQPQEVAEVNEPEGGRIINLFPEQRWQGAGLFSALAPLQADFTQACTFRAAN